MWASWRILILTLLLRFLILRAQKVVLYVEYVSIEIQNCVCLRILVILVKLKFLWILEYLGKSLDLCYVNFYWGTSGALVWLLLVDALNESWEDIYFEAALHTIDLRVWISRDDFRFLPFLAFSLKVQVRNAPVKVAAGWVGKISMSAKAVQRPWRVAWGFLEIKVSCDRGGDGLQGGCVIKVGVGKTSTVSTSTVVEVLLRRHLRRMLELVNSPELKILLERQWVNLLIKISCIYWKLELVNPVFLRSRLRVKKVVVEKSVLDRGGVQQTFWVPTDIFDACQWLRVVRKHIIVRGIVVLIISQLESTLYAFKVFSLADYRTLEFFTVLSLLLEWL